MRRGTNETFDVAYTVLSGVWRLPHRMGWTDQMPTRRAIERDEDATAEWIERTRPDIEKRVPRAGHGSASRTKPKPC
ncbi:winged helix-turn-helix domain-containing protein [Nocardiopsis sp. CNS-639]|uniref:helix-turn-helix domain-containing protein n=1 Tax=Nocardiopsis sp. CNS-639 TaxID=1169153 RepID=UPI00350EA908